MPPESQEVLARQFLDCRRVLRPLAGFALKIGLNTLEKFKVHSLSTQEIQNTGGYARFMMEKSEPQKPAAMLATGQIV